MTGHTPPDPTDREPVLSAADSAEVGRRVREAALTVEAPPSLRARLADAGGAGRARTPLRARGGLLAAGAGGLAALVVGLVIALGGGSGSAPTVADATAVALAGPTAAAPDTAVGGTTLPVRIAGISFPNYAYQWPAWKAVGTRSDTLAGRDARTVVYRGPAGDVGYTIVDGAPLDEPQQGRRVSAGGLKLRVLHRDGATVVTWRRDGHTCVLAGRGRNVERQLVQFATWA